MGVKWNYFNKFGNITDKYLPITGEGDTKATQIVTAVNKLIYKWYNDGDVYDNTYNLEGWANDLSSYANWLSTYVNKSRKILQRIRYIVVESDYEELLKELADTLLDEQFLAEQEAITKVGSIYKCSGEFMFEESEDCGYYDEDDEYY